MRTTQVKRLGQLELMLRMCVVYAMQPAEGGDDPLLILGTLATMRGTVDSVQVSGAWNVDR